MTDEAYETPIYEGEAEIAPPEEPKLVAPVPVALGYLQMDATGIYVDGAGYAPRLIGGQVPVPDGHRPDAFLRHYIVEGVLVPRPVSPVPQGIPNGYRLAACPAGSQIFIYDFESGEVIFQTVIEADDADFDFALPDAGRYVIEVDAPLPFVDTKTMVEVT
jgi:hypothetical protein